VNSFNKIIALVTKEFLAILRDPKSRFVLIGPPVIQMLVFGYAATFDLNNVWFEIPLRGHICTLYIGLSLFLLSSVGVGLMISSLAVTMQQGLLGAFLFLVPSIILSGFTTPIANMPIWIQNLTRINPMRYFLVIIRSTFLEDASFSNLIHQFWPMLLIGVICLTFAGWLFRHRMY